MARLDRATQSARVRAAGDTFLSSRASALARDPGPTVTLARFVHHGERYVGQRHQNPSRPRLSGSRITSLRSVSGMTNSSDQTWLVEALSQKKRPEQRVLRPVLGRDTPVKALDGSKGPSSGRLAGGGASLTIPIWCRNAVFPGRR